MLKEENQVLHLVIQYQEKKIADFRTIEAGLVKGLVKLTERLNKKKAV